jgi:hypothetical protein
MYMTKEVSNSEFAEIIKEGFDRIGTDIHRINEDLIAHDTRTDKMIEMIQALQDQRILEQKVDRIRQFLREKHQVEI